MYRKPSTFVETSELKSSPVQSVNGLVNRMRGRSGIPHALDVPAGIQQVKILPGNWVAPASSYRSDCGGDETVGAFEKDVSLLAMQRADRP
jgi:hypothetical protein